MENDIDRNNETSFEENISKIENMSKEMFEAEEEIQKILDEKDDKYKRLFAEFDNFKKRTAKEKESTFNLAKAQMLEGLLPVIDAMETAINVDTKDENFKEGILLVYEQFVGYLEKNGIESIGIEGEIFNPELHQAIQMQEVEGKDSNTILMVYRKGYKIGDKVIRHAMVIVAK